MTSARLKPAGTGPELRQDFTGASRLFAATQLLFYCLLANPLLTMKVSSVTLNKAAQSLKVLPDFPAVWVQ